MIVSCIVVVQSLTSDACRMQCTFARNSMSLSHPTTLVLEKYNFKRRKCYHLLEAFIESIFQ